MHKRSIGTLALAALLAFPLAVQASSHREAPLIREDPTADNTDVYAYRSADAPSMVTLIANYIPFQEPGQAPNYYDFSEGVLYEIHVDNNGDAKEDITYQFRFRRQVTNVDTFLYNVGPVTSLDDADLNVKYFYSVTRVAGARRTGPGTVLGNFQVAPHNVGPKSSPNYNAVADTAVGTLSSGGGKVFAGPRDDPFFVDIASIGDLLTLRPVQQLHLVPPVIASAPGVDTLQGFNINTIALQVPITALTSNGSAPTELTSPAAVIGVWATASRARVTLTNTGTGSLRQTLGGTSQVSRLGMPLTNEVVLSLKYKDIFNSIEPSSDAPIFTADATFRNRVLDPEVCRLLKALYNINCPPAPRLDIQSVYLTGVAGLNMPPNVVPSDMLRLNVAVPVTAAPNRLGVIGGDTQGFPNGRRLGDDVVDIVLRVAAGVLVTGFNIAPNNALTDGIDANDQTFLTTFPYVAPPRQGFDHGHHPGSTTGPVTP